VRWEAATKGHTRGNTKNTKRTILEKQNVGENCKGYRPVQQKKQKRDSDAGGCIQRGDAKKRGAEDVVVGERGRRKGLAKGKKLLRCLQEKQNWGKSHNREKQEMPLDRKTDAQGE